MIQEQELLIQEHMHIAKSKAGKWCRQQNALTYDELLSTAYLALCKAAQSFDPDRGCHFVGFASICIENAIRSEMRPSISYKQHTSSTEAEDVPEEKEGAEIEDLLALRQALEKLPREDREFLMAYYSGDGKSQRGLAAEQGCSQKAVFKRLRELRDFLRYQMNT